MIVFLILPRVIFLKHWKIHRNFRHCSNLKEKKTRPQPCPLTPPTTREIHESRHSSALEPYSRARSPSLDSQLVKPGVSSAVGILIATSLELKGIISYGAASLHTCSLVAILMFRLRPCILGLGNGERVMGMRKGGRTPFVGTHG